MPILGTNNYEEFHDYLRRKVLEGHPDLEDAMEVKTTAYKSETSKFAGICQRVNNLLNLAFENSIKIPVKVKGKIIDLGDSSTISKIRAETGIQAGLTKPSTIVGRTNYVIGLDTVTRIRQPLTTHAERDHVSTLSYLLVYSTLNVHNKGIVFPSGKQSNKKEK